MVGREMPRRSWEHRGGLHSNVERWGRKWRGQARIQESGDT